MFNQWRAKQGKGGKLPSIESIATGIGMKQSAFSQWLNGTMALNPDAAVSFAQLIGCSVADFSPSIAEYIDHLANGAVRRKAKRGDPDWAAQFTPAQHELLDTLRIYGALMPDDQCRALITLIRSGATGKVLVPI